MLKDLSQSADYNYRLSINSSRYRSCLLRILEKDEGGEIPTLSKKPYIDYIIF